MKVEQPGSPQGSIEKKAKLFFISDTNVVKIPGTDATPSQFRVVMSFLESAMTNKYTVGAGLDADGGYSNIYEESGYLFAKNLSKTLRLNYYGSLSLVPSEGYVHVGTLFKAKLYVFSKATSSSPWFSGSGCTAQ